MSHFHRLSARAVGVVTTALTMITAMLWGSAAAFAQVTPDPIGPAVAPVYERDGLLPGSGNDLTTSGAHTSIWWFVLVAAVAIAMTLLLEQSARRIVSHRHTAAV